MKRSRDAFNSLWGKVIAPALEAYERECEGVTQRDTAKADIWQAYKRFNYHVSQTYMRNPEGLLDRHKVAVCYTLAILVTMPLLIKGKHEEDHLNERVALHVGLTVLASFLAEAVRRAPGFSGELETKALDRIGHGVDFSESVGHGGNYVQSVLNCFAFTQMELQYNVHMLALLYYDWELKLMDPDDHCRIIEYYIETNGYDSDEGLRHYPEKTPC